MVYTVASVCVCNIRIQVKVSVACGGGGTKWQGKYVCIMYDHLLTFQYGGQNNSMVSSGWGMVGYWQGKYMCIIYDHLLTFQSGGGQKNSIVEQQMVDGRVMAG